MFSLIGFVVVTVVAYNVGKRPGENAVAKLKSLIPFGK